jgi:hypothetical protein
MNGQPSSGGATGRRTLVVTLGQLRAHQLTWTNFKTNVLDQLDADLAVCVPDDAAFDASNPFHAGAQHRWLVPDAADYADIFDAIQRALGSREDWRVLCDVPGHWMGRVLQSGQRAAGAVELALRWFMLENIRSGRLDERYERFVVTRSDYYWLCPHPPLACLDPAHVWIPDGEDFGGLCTRHMVVSRDKLVQATNLIADLLLEPRQMRDRMLARPGEWNMERVVAFHLLRNGLLSAVRRFPYVMCLVRTPNDPSTTTLGEYVAELDMLVKYRTELLEAQRYRHMIASNADWHLYFASRRQADLAPARVYTCHGTVLYVDRASGALRHGPLHGSPHNAFLILDRGLWRIVGCEDDDGDDAMSPGGGGGDVARPGAQSDRHRLCGLDGLERETIRQVSSRTGSMNDLCGLRSRDRYLSAQPDGAIILKQGGCRERERFRVISVIRKPASSRFRPVMVAP